MSCQLNVMTVVSPQSAEVSGFSVSKAVRVTAFGLSGKDTVTFKRVQYCSKQPSYVREGCSLFSPEPAQLSNAVDYQIGECLPSLTAKRNTLIIPYAGSYIPVPSGTESADLIVQVEPIDGTQFDDKEKGIAPCGLSEPVQRYEASVPLPIVLYEGGGCGSTFMGYLFHPNETRDPKANVAIHDCEKIVGYAYPQAGDGHTLPIQQCDGVIVGYAVNRSLTAPQQLGGC